MILDVKDKPFKCNGIVAESVKVKMDSGTKRDYGIQNTFKNLYHYEW